MYRKIIGFFRMYFHLYIQGNLRQFEATCKELSRIGPKAIKKKVFVMTVGFSKAGKTVLVNKNKKLKGLFNLSTNKIHNCLNQNFQFLKDDNTVNGEAYWERQFLTRLTRRKVLEKVLSQGIGVINDSSNLNRRERKQRLKIARRYSYKVIIIVVNCSEGVLLSRLQRFDDKLAASGKKRTWINLYAIQKERYNPPLKNEADVIVSFNSEKDNPMALTLW